jgi:hypothetical protein
MISLFIILPVIRAVGLCNVKIEADGESGIRTHDSGHPVHGGLRASTLCSKSALSVYGSSSLPIVVYRLCCQFWVLHHLPCNEMLSPISPFGDPRLERIGVNTFYLYQSLDTVLFVKGHLFFLARNGR